MPWIVAPEAFKFLTEDYSLDCIQTLHVVDYITKDRYKS